MHLETKRLWIRPYQKGDQASILDLLENPKVMKFSLKGPIFKDEAEEYIQTFFIDPLTNQRGWHPIFLKPSKELIGFAGLVDQKVDEGIWPELGYRLHPNFWGKGYAKEACCAICDYAKKELGLKKLISIISPENQPSIYLSESLGFKKEFSTEHKRHLVDIYTKEL